MSIPGDPWMTWTLACAELWGPDMGYTASGAVARSETELFARSVAGTGNPIVTYADRATRHWMFSAIFWLTFVDLVGLTLATELVAPDFFGSTPWLLFSRLRPVHVNGVIWAWLTMMYWSAIWYMAPRLLGVERLWSEKLGIASAWMWNVAYAAGAVTLLLGYTQGREYAEFIWPVDMLIIITWAMNTVNLMMTVAMRRVKTLYVAVWWMMGTSLWLGANYFIGNVMWRPGSMLGNGVPNAVLSGALADPLADAMLNWWQNHNTFGLWLTPGLVFITYYMVPKITNTPLYSHLLSLVSFWGLIFTYTGVGHHHLLQAPIPGWLKTFATVNSILLLLPVFAFVTNTTMTMRGNWEKVFTNMPLRFVITGFIFYFLVNIQGSFMALPGFNRMIHFTNFIVAHAHLALLGGFTILGMGFIDYAIPQIFKRPIYKRSLVEWQYWLVLIGFLTFFFSLTFASFLQGQSWSVGISEVNVLPMLQPHYVARGVGGAMIVTSGIVQAYNIWRTVRGGTGPKVRERSQHYIGAMRQTEQEI